MADNITQGKTFTDLKSLNKIDGSSLFAVHLSGETYKMTYNQLLAQITGDLSYGAFDEIGNRFFSDRNTAPKGCLNCMDGAIYTQADTTYPELWKKIIEGKLNYISLEQYEIELAKRFGENNSLTGVCGYLGVDIPNKTFRMPTYPNAKVALLVGTEPMFYDGQIINIKGKIQDDNGFNWRNGQANGVFYNEANLGPQSWTDDAGRNGNVGVQNYVFDASRVVKTGDQLRVPSTVHCLYMVVSSIRWEIQTVYAFNETVENEIVARTNADIEINNAIAAINEKIEGALTSYYKDTYMELQNFIRDNSAILKVGNVLICGGGSSGEPVRQFIWSGNTAIETSANVVLDNYYSKQQVDNFLDNKVDKIPGKSLSQNDYTNAEKVRLSQSVLEPEYAAFKNNTQIKIDNLTNSINQEILDRKNNDIVEGSTEGNKELSNVNPILYLHKENGDKVAIPLDVLKNYLNSNSKGSNGSALLENIDSSSAEVEETDDLGYFQMKDTKTSDNTTALIKTHRSTNDPVRLEFSLSHNTNPEDSVRLVLLNNGYKKRLYLLKDKELPTNTSEVQSLDEVLNKKEIMDYVSAEIAEALTGVLPIPTVLALESELPDISEGSKETYYFVINNMNITSPILERQGRAWCGVGATTWQKIVDTVNTLSSDSFQQKEDGSWIINEATQTLIDGAIQNSQITTTEPNSSSTDQEVTSAKSVYTGLEKRISKSSIDVIEPTSLSTDDTVPSSKLINSMMGGNLSSLTTKDKTVIGSLNELNQNKVNQSLNNINEEGQNYLSSLVSSQYISVGQLVPLMFPSNDAKLHLADGTLISQIGKYAQFSNYLKEIEEKYGTQMDLFCTQAEWDETLNTYGYCPKFVIDNVNQTIRLPLLKGYMKGVNSIVDLGKINEAGLPNIKGSFYNVQSAVGNIATGAFDDSSLATGYKVGGGNSVYSGTMTFNSSKSSSVYKDGLNTVEVDGYNCLVYIVVATGVSQSISIVENYEVNNTVPLTCPVYSPNLFEDVNYLLSDNQWHSGAMYLAVWELLISQYNNENSVEITKTLSDGTSLTLKKTPLDYLICKIDENNTEEKINRFYDEIKFTCWVINTTTNEFKLPQNTRRELVESYISSDGLSWYRKYSDGWTEQGGMIGRNYSTNANINFLVPFKDTKYIVNFANYSTEEGTIANKRGVCINGYTSTGISFISNPYVKCWEAKGYANTSALNNQFNFSNYLYFKVGNTTVNPETIDISQLTVEVNNKANISGDNVKFDNLSNTAKNNITNIIGWQKIGEFEINNDMEIEFTGLNDGYQHKFEFTNISSLEDAAYMMAVLGNSFGYANTGYSGCLFSRWSQVTNQWLMDSVGYENSNNLIITSNHNDYWSLSYNNNSYINFEIKSNLGFGGDQFFEFNSMVKSPVQSDRLMVTNGNGMLVSGLIFDRIKFFLSIGSFTKGTVKHYIMK